MRKRANEAPRRRRRLTCGTSPFPFDALCVCKATREKRNRVTVTPYCMTMRLRPCVEFKARITPIIMHCSYDCSSQRNADENVDKTRTHVGLTPNILEKKKKHDASRRHIWYSLSKNVRTF